MASIPAAWRVTVSWPMRPRYYEHAHRFTQRRLAGNEDDLRHLFALLYEGHVTGVEVIQRPRGFTVLMTVPAIEPRSPQSPAGYRTSSGLAADVALHCSRLGYSSLFGGGALDVMLPEPVRVTVKPARETESSGG